MGVTKWQELPNMGLAIEIQVLLHTKKIKMITIGFQMGTFLAWQFWNTKGGQAEVNITGLKKNRYEPFCCLNKINNFFFIKRQSNDYLNMQFIAFKE